MKTRKNYNKMTVGFSPDYSNFSAQISIKHFFWRASKPHILLPCHKTFEKAMI